MDVKKCEITCEYKGWIVPRIVRSVTFPRSLPCHFINSGFIPHVVSTPWIVRVCSTNKQLIRVHFGENSDVVVAVVSRLPLDQTQLHIPVPGVPVDSVVQVLLQIAQTEIVDNIPGSDQQRVPILPEKLEVVRVSVISRKCVNLVCKIAKIWSEVPSGK